MKYTIILGDGISDRSIESLGGKTPLTVADIPNIDSLQEELGSDTMIFHPGVSYRHLFVLKEGNDSVSCTPPYDVPGTVFAEVMVTPSEAGGEKTAALLNILILRSQKILKDHPVNLKRIAEGKDPANREVHHGRNQKDGRECCYRHHS